MYSVIRNDVLVAMVKLRSLSGIAPPLDHRAAIEMVHNACAETRILEIVELAHSLGADDLRVAQILERIERVHGPFPPEYFLSLTMPCEWVTHVLKRDYPDYPVDNTLLLESAMSLASVWGTYLPLTLGGWPGADILSEPWDIDGNTGLIRMGDAGEVEWPAFTRTLADIDLLLKEYGGETAVVLRRMKARANPGDTLHGFSTSRLSWAIMGGRSGIAHVRKGRSIDYFVTMMN